jgi:phospholipid/cholesterol/gamma-HCH transport system substrate-binding protein
MKKSNKQKFNLGLFVVISSLALITALYFIGKKQNLFGKTFTISAVFSNVNGLQLGNNVRYSGINVGTVKGIDMLNDTTIFVELIIESKMLEHMKKNAIAAIGSDGLVGSMIINIVPNRKASVPIITGDTIISYSKITTNDMLSTLNTTNENAALLTADLLKITTDINKGKGVIGTLINDSVMDASFKQTIKNLKVSSANISITIDELNKIIKSVDYENSLVAVLLSDSISGIKIKTIIENLEKSSHGIDSVLTNISDVVVEFKDGKGTLNYVVNDTILVNDVDETIKNFKEGSVLLNENLEALKHNFLLRGYFKKLEKEKLKEEKKKEK